MTTEIYYGLEIKDWVMVAAVLVGPILAVQSQKIIEKLREKRLRRFAIFKSLMSTRAERVSREHVQALNLIDIEFYGRMYFGVRYQTKSEKAVTNSWKNYNSHLNDKSFAQTIGDRPRLFCLRKQTIGDRPRLFCLR